MRSKAGGLLVVLFLAACGPWQARPNVVLVLADTLRADYLGCYGFEGDTSPHLDRLAGESVRFEACFSQAPWTKPAVASLFTSLYPQTHGVLTHDGMFAERGTGAPASLETDVLPSAARTLAELMAEGGYVTQAFVTNPWIRREHGFAQGFAGFEQSLPVERSTGEVFEAAANWVEQEDRKAPFFLYLHLMEVHGPYDAPEGDVAAVAAAPGLGLSHALTARDQRRLPEYLRLADWARGPGAGDLRTWRMRYAAGVHAFDRLFGEFLERLRAAGRLEDTLLIVTSDHGEELLEHGSWDHGSSLHDHQLYVPLLIRLPGAERGGKVVRTPTELIDLAPTILSHAGLPVPANIQGENLNVPPTLEVNRSTLSSAVKWKPGLVSLRTGRHRLIAGGADGALELYDLRQDPDEQVDLAAEEPDLVRKLSALLIERLRVLESVEPLAGERAAVSEDLRGKLEDLGYF